MTRRVEIIRRGSALYPELLHHIASPPKQLFVLGDLARLKDTKAVGIVGSRAVTPYGRQVTHELAAAVAKRGVAVISGLALGVDALAHEATLEAGGYTIAVMAGGLDEISPRANLRLAERILEQGGAIISEYPTGVPPLKQNFIARNRIIAGLSDGLLVTEASETSGALHTAQFALTENRTVMVVPGKITDAMSAGCNTLLKEPRALPVTCVEDILEAIQEDAEVTNLAVMGANAEEAIILEYLKRGVSDINALQTASELAAEVFNQTLTMLEITGKIKPLGAGHYGIR
jgi:DNA processing protein